MTSRLLGLGLSAVLLLGTSGATAQPQSAPHAATERLDYRAIEARTHRYLAARQRARLAKADSPDEIRAARDRLDKAQLEVGPPRGLWDRLTGSAKGPGSAEAAADELEWVLTDITIRASRLRQKQQRVEALVADDPRLLERLRHSQAELSARSAELHDLGSRAVVGLRFENGTRGERLAQWLNALGGEDPRYLLDVLRQRLAEWNAAPETTILGSELTYVHGALTPEPLPSAETIPAYQAGPGVFPTLEDTTVGREVEVSPEIQALADSLGTPKAAYDHVKNELKLDWYHGSLKSSTETLREGRGNDADLAALLIALLRAQDVPARYVIGTVELPIGKLADLMGLLSTAEVTALYDRNTPFTPTAAARDRVLLALGNAGIPFEPVDEGGHTRAVHLLHVWVEAYVAYADYRGRAEGPEGNLKGKQWVPLDPAIPGRAKYAAADPVVDLLTETPFTPQGLTDAYLSAPTALTARQYYRQEIQTWLAANQPSVGWEQLKRQVQQQPERLDHLPGSLPYKVVQVHEELPFLPESLQHRMRLTVTGAAGQLLQVTLPLHQVVGRRTTLSYVPATPAEAALVQDSGGLYAAPAALVEVIPILRVGGRDQGVATGALGLGEMHDLLVEMLLPNGATRRIANRVVAGNLIAIGVGGPLNGHAEPADRDPLDQDGPAPRFLYGRAAAYANAWTEAEDELAALVSVVPLRPTASVVFVQNQLQVDQVLGIRSQVVFRGLEVDADLRTATPLELHPGRGVALLRLSGYEGSALERSVLTEGTGVESVAATTVLQEAAAHGVPVVTIDASNLDTELPLLALPPAVHSDVQDLVARGREVRIPRAELTLLNWTGAGYIARDPVTEEAGYFLSGVISGGQTIVSPGGWADQELVEQLSFPGQPGAVKDPTLATSIRKIHISDQQGTDVGTMAIQPLGVLVTTADGRAVEGANVTFSRLGGAQSGLTKTLEQMATELANPDPQVVENWVHGLPATVSELTGPDGQVRVYFTPDPTIENSAILASVEGATHKQLVGLNEITAWVTLPSTNLLKLAEPFFLVGLPTDAQSATQIPSTPIVDADPGIELGGRLRATIRDRFGNRLANKIVTWASNPTGGAFIGPAIRDDHSIATLGGPNQIPILETTTPTDGEVRVDFIPAAAGQVIITANSGAVSAVFPVTVRDAADYTFRLAKDSDTLFHGITGTALNAPIFGQILHNTGTSTIPVWSVVKGDEPNLARAEVNLSIVEGVWSGSGFVPGNPLIPDEVQKPLDMNPAVHNDDQEHVAFRPKYQEPSSGVQLMTFSAVVEEVDPVSPKRVCCSETFQLNPVAALPRITLTRVLDKLTTKSVPAGGIALVSDEEVRFEIAHPRDGPIYLRLVQEPTAILEIGGPDRMPRHLNDAGLLEAPASLGVVTNPDGTLTFGRSEFRFGVLPDSDPGLVTFEIEVPDVDDLGHPVLRRLPDPIALEMHRLDLSARCSNDEREATHGIFVQRRRLAASTPIVFESEKFMMRLLDLNVSKKFDGVEIGLVDPSLAAVLARSTINGEPTLLSLSGANAAQQLSTALFAPDGSVDTQIYVRGLKTGETTLFVRLIRDGSEIARDEVTLRIGDLPSLVGVPFSGYPHWRTRQVVNELETVSVAVDPFVHDERRGFPAKVYVVPHRTMQEWSSISTLADATGTPESLMIAEDSTSIEQNMRSIWSSARSAGNAAKAYDVVLDYAGCNAGGTYGTLDEEDLVLAIDDNKPSLVVLPPLTKQGQACGGTACAAIEYGNDFEDPAVPSADCTPVADAAGAYCVETQFCQFEETCIPDQSGTGHCTQVSPISTRCSADEVCINTNADRSAHCVPSAKRIVIPRGWKALGTKSIREQCANGIDDDADGAIDCQDSECANDVFDPNGPPVRQYCWPGFRLRGRVVHPSAAGGQPWPLVVLVHGRHYPLVSRLSNPGGKGPWERSPPEAKIDAHSYRGFGYLQEILASNGIASISVDMDELVGFAGRQDNAPVGYPSNPGTDRAHIGGWLVLKNLEHVRTTYSQLAASIDWSQIVLVGHSRGGESVMAADWILDDSINRGPPRQGLPTADGLLDLGIGGTKANIVSVVGLAPVSHLTNPIAQNKPLLIIWGSADGDQHGASSRTRIMGHIDRAIGYRAGVVVLGGNHDNFNTSWTSDDSSRDGAQAEYKITSTQQLEFTKGYLLAWARYLGGKNEYAEVFEKDPTIIRPLGVDLGIDVRTQGRRGTGAFIVDNYENGQEAIAFSGADVVFNGGTLPLWEGELLATMHTEASGFNQETGGLIVEWSGKSDVVTRIAGGQNWDFEGLQELSFRVAQQPKHPNNIGAYLGEKDFSVTLVDASGERAAVPLGISGLVGVPFTKSKTSSQVPPTTMDRSVAIFQTVRIELNRFTVDGAAIDLSRISAIEMNFAGVDFSPVGRIAFDDLEVEPR